VTKDQALALAVLAGTMAVFIWGRLRYDLVAVLALLAAVFTGIVPHKAAFPGFGDDIVIIVGSALIVSAAVERSGATLTALSKVSRHITSVQGQLVVLVAAVTILSALVKNIGALAMMIPVAFQMARRSRASPSFFLMPMAFGSLLGGLITLVGTSPNIIVSRIREEITGRAFSLFDFTPAGIGLAAAGLAFLSFGYRLLPPGRKPAPVMDQALDIKGYMTEARIAAGSGLIGHTASEVSKRSDGEVTVTGIIRGGTGTTTPPSDELLREDDIVLLEGDPQALERAVARSDLKLEGQHSARPMELSTGPSW
jgi:di/tricarboxylate transporter